MSIETILHILNKKNCLKIICLTFFFFWRWTVSFKAHLRSNRARRLPSHYPEHCQQPTPLPARSLCTHLTVFAKLSSGVRTLFACNCANRCSWLASGEPSGSSSACLRNVSAWEVDGPNMANEASWVGQVIGGRVWGRPSHLWGRIFG